MSILTLVQEVYFDLCDLLAENDCDMELEGFSEFSTLAEFAADQRQKLAEIERMLTLGGAQ